MAKRGSASRDEHGVWDIGAGSIEFGDTIEETLKREIKEEYCTDVLSAEFLGYRDVHREHHGEQTHWVALDFAVKVEPVTVGNGEPDKFEEVRWFTLDAMPKELHSQLPRFLELYRHRLS